MDSRELIPPPSAVDDKKAREMLRAWIAHGGLHCTVDVGSWGDDEPLAWGILLSDVARHVADALQKDKGWDKADSLKKIREVFDSEIAAPTAPTSGKFV